MAIFTKEGIHEIFEVNNDKDYIVNEIARSVRKRSELNDYIVELTKLCMT
ncbi:hypothetical protein [Helicobacter apodemus]|nr:hypothetical protein [Helicobacter apodemus]